MKLKLRVFELDVVHPAGRKLIEEHEPFSGARSYYIHVPGAGKRYVCDLGFQTLGGEFLLVATSNELLTPRNEIAGDMDASWITLDNYTQVFSEAPDALVDLDQKRRFIQELFARTGSSAPQENAGSIAVLDLSSAALQELSSYLMSELSSHNLSELSSKALSELSSHIVTELSSMLLSALSSKVS